MKENKKIKIIEHGKHEIIKDIKDFLPEWCCVSCVQAEVNVRICLFLKTDAETKSMFILRPFQTLVLEVVNDKSISYSLIHKNITLRHKTFLLTG